jgi:thiol-disulfide isomerase/thioredoxin
MLMRCLSSALALAVGLSFTVAAAVDRSAEDILKELASVKITPPTAKGKSQGPVYTTTKEVETRKAQLIRELYVFHPKHPQVVKLLPQRWTAMYTLGQGDAVAKEVEEAATQLKDDSLRAEGAYIVASKAVEKRLKNDAAGALKEVETFLEAAPQDARGAALLSKIAASPSEAGVKSAARKRLLKDFAGTAEAKRIAATTKSDTSGSTSGSADIGKPFDLEFNDAISGETVSIKDLKGKVVVVDFWATWCGPCVAEMPNMKKLHAEFKGKGVEFIGVSLDQPESQGGLKALREYVAKNEINWPQYYQGNFWDSAFSKSLGINSIPCVYIVDAEGKLYSTKARGQLEKLIPELLEKAKSGPKG